MTSLSIDPGTFESGYTIFDSKVISNFGKIKNEELIAFMDNYVNHFDTVVIEMLKSYGTLIGDSVLETAVWIGRFEQHAINLNKNVYKIHRKAVVTYLCGTPKANDKNIKRALIDRFAPNVSNMGKGKKGENGFFHGFKEDIWQSFALNVYFQDKHG